MVRANRHPDVFAVLAVLLHYFRVRQAQAGNQRADRADEFERENGGKVTWLGLELACAGFCVPGKAARVAFLALADICLMLSACPVIGSR